MIKHEDHCVGCPLPCIPNCPNRNVEIEVCDACEEEEQLYRYDGNVYCIDCLFELLGIEKI